MGSRALDRIWIFLAAALAGAPGARAEEAAEPVHSLRAPASGLDAAHRRLYEKVRPSIVGVRARGTLGEVSGSGVLLDAQGTILTSSSVVGRGAENIRVWLAGPRLATARLIGVRAEDECALLRIDAPDLKPIPMGDSDALAVGRRIYTVGNAENALINDDQATLSVGVLSGIYGVRDERMGSTYTGRVLETTAAVNPGMEGGALVDEDGRLVGMVVLNYSPVRWLGVAVPLNALKPAIAALRRKEGEADAPPEAEAGGGEAYFGADVEADALGAGLRIRAVAPDSPADAAGLTPGNRILEIGGKKASTPADVQAAIEREKPGTLLWITVDIGGEVREIRITLGTKAAPQK